MSSIGKHNSRVAVTGELVPMLLKQKLLLFDRLAIIDLESAPRFARMPSLLGSGHDETVAYWNDVANDLEYLQEAGLIFDVGDPYERAKELMDDVRSKDELMEWAYVVASGDDLLAVHESLMKLKRRPPKSKEGLKRGYRLIGDFIVKKTGWHQFCSRIIAHRLRKFDNLDAVPLIPDKLIIPRSFQKKSLATSTTVVEIVLNKIPMPDETTPWEKIIDFRDDSESQGYLQGLRVWMAELSRQDLSPKEAEEKLDWLLFEHRQRMKVHRIKYGLNTLGSVFVSTMEIVEDLVKIKWGKAAKGIVALTNRKAELLSLEIESPTRAVNYLIRTQREFGEEQA